MGPRCPETSVTNYHNSLRNDPEERDSYLLRCTAQVWWRRHASCFFNAICIDIWAAAKQKVKTDWCSKKKTKMQKKMKDKKKCKNHFNECPFRLGPNDLQVMKPVANWSLGSKNERNLGKKKESAVNGHTITLITANYILPWHYLIHWLLAGTLWRGTHFT